VKQDQDATVDGGNACDRCEPDPCECEPHPCNDKCEPHPCGCPHDGSIDQSQDAKNENDTDQDADADATTEQKNENKPFSFLSPGFGGGDVTQSNDATTTAWAGNWNDTDQSVDQRQFADVRR
jgi:hypothetical protein